jgi:hypothetical protein
MERVLPNLFSESEIKFILQFIKREFVKIEDTEFNTKFYDSKFDLFWEVIYDKIKDALPSKTFTIKGGFVNQTNSPYKIHSDGARTPDEDILCTVLLPLELIFKDQDQYDHQNNRLFIFDQTSEFATTFRLNVNDAVKAPYYRLATSLDDYQAMIKGLNDLSFNDQRVLSLCDHLSPDEFFGLSVKMEIPWDIGSCVIFHPHNLHVSSNFTKLGVSNKTNLVYSLKK